MARADTRSAGSSATLLLLIANAALAGLAWLALTQDVPTTPVPLQADQSPAEISRRVAASAPVAASPPWAVAPLPDVAKLNQTRERPLFRPDRRPPKPEAAAPPAAASVDTATQPQSAEERLALPGELKLVGIIAMPGRNRRAVFRQDAPRTSVSLEAGERIGDWRIVEIRAESVVVEAGRQRKILQLYEPSAASAESQRR